MANQQALNANGEVESLGSMLAVLLGKDTSEVETLLENHFKTRGDKDRDGLRAELRGEIVRGNDTLRDEFTSGISKAREHVSKEIVLLKEKVAGYEEVIEGLRAEISGTKGTLANRDEKIVELNVVVSDRDETIAKLTVKARDAEKREKALLRQFSKFEKHRDMVFEEMRNENDGLRSRDHRFLVLKKAETAQASSAAAASSNNNLESATFANRAVVDLTQDFEDTVPEAPDTVQPSSSSPTSLLTRKDGQYINPFPPPRASDEDPIPPPPEERSLIHKTLPGPENKAVLLDSDDEMSYEDLLVEIKQEVEKMFQGFVTAKNAKLAGADWWAKLQGLKRYNKKTEPRKVCLAYVFSSSGQPVWTIEHAAEYACLTCTNAQRPCLLYDHESKQIGILPLVKVARSEGEDTTPDKPGYWVCNRKAFSSGHKKDRELWVGAENRSKRKANDGEASTRPEQTARLEEACCLLVWGVCVAGMLWGC